MYEVVKKVDGSTYIYHGWDYKNQQPKLYWNYINGGHPFKSLKSAEKAKAKIDAYCRAISDDYYYAKQWKENECEIRSLA